MAWRILVSDPIAREGVERLRRAPGVEVVEGDQLEGEGLRAALAESDALIVRSRTRVTAELLQAAPRLKVIGRAGVGVDNIDVEAATRRGILVINSPDGNTISAAEHTIAMMLALARQIPQAHHALVHQRRWDRQRYVGVQLQGKVLGVVGLGRIGSEVARRAQGLDMQVLGFDPFLSAERAKLLQLELVDLEELCRRSDFITVHVPLTAATTGLINRRHFELMKPGVRLINCARGGVIDESDLHAAIAAGKVAGAALDVFSEEPPWGNPLLELEQVVCTPHLGASTQEAQVNVAVDVAEGVLRALEGLPVRGAVNAPAFAEDVEGLRPFLELAERLGRLYTSLIEGGYQRLSVVYGGEAAQWDTRALTAAVLKGMLSPILQEVNYINAPILARERQIRVAEVKEQVADDFANLIALKAHVNGVERMVAGSVMGPHQVPTLVAIDGYRLSVQMVGRLLVARNVDRPGMIGRVGTVLGEAGINIAFMQVGRQVIGGDAVMVLGVDNPIPPEVLARLQQLDNLWDVRIVDWS